MSAPEYEIREFRDGDEHSLIETFNTVFARGEGSVPPMSAEKWDWLYRRNPAGRRLWVALHEGCVVAQYAALPIRVWIDASERIFAQIVDSMVHPDHRGGLKRPGLFVNTALPFFEAYGGVDKDLVHYGWPVVEAWRIGKAFLKYEIVRTQNVLVRELGEGAAEVPAEIERIERFDHQARWLYERCSGAWGVSGIRDDAYLNWRFVEHPEHRYTIYGVRDGEGILRGYAVYRTTDWVLPQMGILVDWLVPPEEPEVGELLLRAALASARSEGACVLAAMVPDCSPWFVTLQRWGFLVHPSDYFLVSRHFDRRFDTQWLRESWWYQFADTDLV
jgi:hypothetical protein